MDTWGPLERLHPLWNEGLCWRGWQKWKWIAPKTERQPVSPEIRDAWSPFILLLNLTKLFNNVCGKLLCFEQNKRNIFLVSLSYPTGLITDEVDEQGWQFWASHLWGGGIWDGHEALSTGFPDAPKGIWAKVQELGHLRKNNSSQCLKWGGICQQLGNKGTIDFWWKTHMTSFWPHEK